MSTTTTYSVPEISCGHCKAAIEGAVVDVPHVERVEVDIESKTVMVVGGETAAIVAAIEDAGYDVDR